MGRVSYPIDIGEKHTGTCVSDVCGLTTDYNGTHDTHVTSGSQLFADALPLLYTAAATYDHTTTWKDAGHA